MKNFVKRHQDVLTETLIFFIATILYVVLLLMLKQTFGQTVGDFESQHIRFIDYLRNSFFKTHDLAPQMTMNLGGTQNMAALFYHGQYNPLIMLSYLFPFISTINWVRLLFVIIATLSFGAMNFLLEQHKISRTIRIVVSAMTVFTMPFLFQSGNHINFLYYYPIMIISLIAIRMIIKQEKIWLFIICVALIFYTNFFFALVIGFMQLMYFIVCLYYENTFSKKERLKKFQKLFLAYLVGIMLGCLVLLPQFLIVLSSQRTGNVKAVVPFFYNGSLEQLVVGRYASGLGLIVPTVFIMSIVNYKDKFNLILISAALLCVVLGPFNYLLNIFQYTHYKVFIYTIPVIMLVLARILNSKEKDRKFGIVLLISMIVSLIIIYFDKTQDIPNIKHRLLLMGYIVFQAVILFLLYYRPKYKWLLALSFVLLMFAITKGTPNFVRNDKIAKEVTHQNLIAKDFKLNKKDDFYRSISDVNLVRAINDYSPTLYASLPNGEMTTFNRDTVEMEAYKFSRKVQPWAYQNVFMRNLLGINSYIDNKTGQETNFNNVKPFIYGVNNDNIYNQSSLDKESKLQRLFALNEHVYNKTSTKIAQPRNYVMQNIITDNQVYTAKQLNNKVYQIPAQYQKNGIIIMKMENISDPTVLTKVKVGHHVNYFYGRNIYNEPPHKVGYFFWDASDKLKNLVIKTTLNEQKFTKIKIDYIPQSVIDNNLMKNYIKASSIKIDPNKAYEFDLNLPKPGMLATSIFYDDGFNILVDGKKVPNEKINYNFLGANLNQGNHHIKITYTMPGFKAGLVISFIGLFILGFVMISEIKALNKPFFRFVIVGVFNTVNYFIMFTVLNNIGVSYILAHLCAFLYSAFVSYFLTSYYTFKTKPSIKTMTRFPITYLPNLILSTLGTIILVENNLLSESIASLVVMIASIPITFIISKLIFHNKSNDRDGFKTD